MAVGLGLGHLFPAPFKSMSYAYLARECPRPGCPKHTGAQFPGNPRCGLLLALRASRNAFATMSDSNVSTRRAGSHGTAWCS